VRGRITGLTIVILALFALILVQAVVVQVRRANALDQSPLNPRVYEIPTLYPRGNIVASNGILLAKSIPTHNVNFPWRRSYPLGRLVSDIVGYSSIEYGTGGIEQEYNGFLISHLQPATSLTQVLAPQRAADNLTLTLNIALQQVADRALAGRNGAVVALDPTTGAVLAMYSNPTYNPVPLTSLSLSEQENAWKEDTTFDSEGFQPFNNVATQETFPPGSTFKVVTTAAIERYYPALANVSIPYRVCTPLPESTKVLCNSGLSPCGGTIQVMLPASCDPGYADLGMDLGADDLYDEATQFGYDRIPPLDLPGVVPARFPTLDFLAQNGPPSVAYSAIGQQDVSSTALQGALVAEGIADGGTVMAPHLLERVTNSLTGETVHVYKPWAWRHALGANEAAQVVPLMESVVRDGTASSVGFLYEDDVAAKTGTAQTGDEEGLTDDWMIAFAPATDPVVAAAVVLPYQPNYDFGATIAGPVMKCVIEAALAIEAGQPAANTDTTCPS
jgi:peptidoglycan glycosyltransferase